MLTVVWNFGGTGPWIWAVIPGREVVMWWFEMKTGSAVIAGDGHLWIGLHGAGLEIAAMGSCGLSGSVNRVHGKAFVVCSSRSLALQFFFLVSAPVLLLIFFFFFFFFFACSSGEETWR
jgi:hypothetical protein